MGNAATLELLHKHKAAIKAMKESPTLPDIPRRKKEPSEPTIPRPAALMKVTASFAGEPFSSESLTVKAWQMFPRLFGLPGWHDLYPDNHQVLAMLCGKRGLVQKGFLIRRNDGLLQVKS